MDTSSLNPKEYQTGRTVNIKKLQTDAPNPPQYLIRVHSARSQGQMTDHEFLSQAERFAVETGSPPPNLLGYAPLQFETHAHYHLTNYKGNEAEPFRSPFISLTVSLRTALAWAKMRSQWRHKDIKIAILDTNSIIRNCDCGTASCSNEFHTNPIFPANMLYKACHGRTKDYPDEFVAFGHVRGAFKVCTFAELDTSFLSTYLPELNRLPRDQRYEELPIALETLWKTEQEIRSQERGMIIHMAKQLSNDNLLIPMTAFVLCVRRRDPNDRQVLATIVQAATVAEKRATYDFLGYFDAFPVFDFFSKGHGGQITTADSPELLQTSALLERVKSYFAEMQEKEARTLWNCTTVALVCRRYCPAQIGNGVTKTSLTSRKFISGDINRAFARLQRAVFKTKYGGLRMLLDALALANRKYNLHMGLITPISATGENEHEYWTRTFAAIATQIESYTGFAPVDPTMAIMGMPSDVPSLTNDPRKAFEAARKLEASQKSFATRG